MVQRESADAMHSLLPKAPFRSILRATHLGTEDFLTFPRAALFALFLLSHYHQPVVTLVENSSPTSLAGFSVAFCVFQRITVTPK